MVIRNVAASQGLVSSPTVYALGTLLRHQFHTPPNTYITIVRVHSTLKLKNKKRRELADAWHDQATPVPARCDPSRSEQPALYVSCPKHLGRSDIPRRLNDPQDANHWPEVPKAPMGRPLLVALLLRRHH